MSNVCCSSDSAVISIARSRMCAHNSHCDKSVCVATHPPDARDNWTARLARHGVYVRSVLEHNAAGTTQPNRDWCCSYTTNPTTFLPRPRIASPGRSCRMRWKLIERQVFLLTVTPARLRAIQTTRHSPLRRPSLMYVVALFTVVSHAWYATVRPLFCHPQPSVRHSPLGIHSNNPPTLNTQYACTLTHTRELVAAVCVHGSLRPSAASPPGRHGGNLLTEH